MGRTEDFEMSNTIFHLLCCPLSLLLFPLTNAHNSEHTHIRIRNTKIQIEQNTNPEISQILKISILTLQTLPLPLPLLLPFLTHHTHLHCHLLRLENRLIQIKTKRIKFLHKTTIIIAHRISVIFTA